MRSRMFHSAVIGVARTFVNVVFTEYDPTAFYTAGRPNAVSVINGMLREGMTARCGANS
jgi:hypothetical protein